MIFTACFLYVRQKHALQTYVADRQQARCYRIRCEAYETVCRCWSAVDSIRESRFITKPSLLCHGSIDALSDGKPIYVAEEAAYQAFGLRPTPQKRRTEIITEVINEAKKRDVALTNERLLQVVLEHPEIRGVSKAQIRTIANGLKPEGWSRPGRRPSVRHK